MAIFKYKSVASGHGSEKKIKKKYLSPMVSFLAARRWPVASPVNTGPRNYHHGGERSKKE